MGIDDLVEELAARVSALACDGGPMVRFHLTSEPHPSGALADVEVCEDTGQAIMHVSLAHGLDAAALAMSIAATEAARSDSWRQVLSAVPAVTHIPVRR